MFRMELKQSSLLIAVASAVLFLSACGARVRSTIAVPDVYPGAELSDARGGVEKSFISVDEVKDVRAERMLALVNGKTVEPDEDIVQAVRIGLQKAFEKKGIGVSDSAPLVISSEVRTWVANVKTGLPSNVRSEASVYVKVFDPANKLIFKGLYEGSSSIQHGSIDEKDIRESLSTAMSEALSQVVNDRQLTSLVSAY